MFLFDFCEECITVPKSALRGKGTDNPILLNHRRKNSRNDTKKEIPQFHAYEATTFCGIRNRLALKRASEECDLNSTVLLSKRDRMHNPVKSKNASTRVCRTELKLAVTTMHGCWNLTDPAILFSTLIQLKNKSTAVETDVGDVTSTF